MFRGRVTPTKIDKICLCKKSRAKGELLVCRYSLPEVWTVDQIVFTKRGRIQCTRRSAALIPDRQKMQCYNQIWNQTNPSKTSYCPTPPLPQPWALNYSKISRSNNSNVTVTRWWQNHCTSNCTGTRRRACGYIRISKCSERSTSKTCASCSEFNVAIWGVISSCLVWWHRKTGTCCAIK